MVYFSGDGTKLTDTILSIAKDIYGIEGDKIGIKIPMQSEKMPYFISGCNIYLKNDDPKIHEITETILKLTYDIHGEEVSALIHGSGRYVRTISIKGNGYTFDGKLKFCSDSIETLVNMDLPDSSFIKWQIYEGRFKEWGYNL